MPYRLQASDADDDLVLQISLRGLPAGPFELVVEQHAEAAGTTSTVTSWQNAEFEIARAGESDGAAEDVPLAAAADADEEAQWSAEAADAAARGSAWGELYILTCISDR